MKLTKERGRQLRDTWHNIIRHYGESKFQDNILDLNIYSNPDDSVYGECEDLLNECSINVSQLYTWRRCVEVLIEEYTHYLQSPHWFERYYTMGHTYETHPYELQAQEIAKKDAHLFL